MRLALAQINAVVGDLDGNRERILPALEEARAAGSGARPLPRARGHGLPARGPAPPARVRARPPRSRCAEIARGLHGHRRARRHAVVRPRPLQRVRGLRRRRGRGALPQALLPNYGVFDEDRYFAPGRELLLLRLGDDADRADRVRGHLAARAARDRPRARGRRAARQPLRLAVPRRQGRGPRGDARHPRARQLAAYLAFCNLVGGQDELLFDGHSVVLDDEGEVLARAPGFEEALLVVDLDPSEAIGRRLRDVRRRALAGEREDEPEPAARRARSQVTV